jgi:hypothetical protein
MVAPKIKFKYKWKLINKCEYPIIGSNGEEGIKCSWCVKFKEDTPYASEGRSTIQLSGLNGHALFVGHKSSIQLLEIK